MTRDDGRCDHAACSGPDPVADHHALWLDLRARHRADQLDHTSPDVLADAVAAENAAIRRADSSWAPAGRVRRDTGTIYRSHRDRGLRRARGLFITGLLLMFLAAVGGVVAGIIAGVQLAWWAP